MAVTLTNDISRMLALGIRDVFTKNFDSYPVEFPSYTTAKTATEETTYWDSMGNIAGAQDKTEGDEVVYRKIAQAYQTSCKMITVANGIRFTIEAKSYDKYKATAEADAKELARTMRDEEEAKAIKWINNATSAAYALADGAALATNSRVLKNVPGTYNDTYATASALADPDNHKTMVKMFADFKNHAGGHMKTYPTNGMTHRYNMADIEEVYQSDKKANELSNTKNVLKSIQWAYSTFMTDTDAWMMWDNRFEHILFVKFRGVWHNSGEDKEKTFDFWHNTAEMYNTCCLVPMGFVYNDGA